MNTAAQIRPPRRPSGPTQPTVPRGGTGAPASERRTVDETLAEIVPLIEYVPYQGPPVVFVLVPWLFVVVMLAGPFACLFALVVLIVVAAMVLAAVTAAILAAPYLLIRHRRRHRARHASISPLAAQPVAIESRRAAA